jgi:hypothetical protein
MVHIFSNQKSQLRYILEGFAMEDVDLLNTYTYVRLACFTAIWSILWPFGIFYGHLVYFYRFGMLHQQNMAILHQAGSNNKDGNSITLLTNYVGIANKLFWNILGIFRAHLIIHTKVCM